MYLKWMLLTFLPGTLAQVFVNEFVSYPGGPARFHCSSISSRSIVSIKWLLNGLSLQSLNLSNVIQSLHRYVETNEIAGGILRFADIQIEYNNTIIQCSVEYTTGSPDVSNRVLLLLQGTLCAVHNLAFSSQLQTISLSWEAPQTFDITGNTVDITYCVDVVNSTTSETLFSMCGIITPNFTYPKPLEDYCNHIMFTVTPVNVVGNGTSRTILYSQTEKSPAIHQIDTVKGIITMTASMCTVQLTILDVDTGMTVTLDTTSLNISGNSIFISSQLNDNQRYSVTVVASNIAGSATSETIISTHQIRNVAVIEESSAITIETDYFNHSTESCGALYIFVPLNDRGTIDLTRAVYLTLNKNNSYNQTVPFILSDGRMAVFVYDVENGTLASGVVYPAVNRELVINDTTQGLPFHQSYSYLENCSVAKTDVIIVDCGYPNDSLATGFQVIVQKHGDDVHRLYANKTTDHQTSTSVMVEKNGLYQVTVFAIRERRGIFNSNVEYTTLIVDTSNVEYTTLIVDTSAITIAPNGCTLTSIDVLIPALATSIGMVLGLGVSILGVIIVIKCCKIKNNSNSKDELNEDERKRDTDISQLYEEISSIKMNTISARVPGTAAPANVVNYEEVGKVPKYCSDPYRIIQCSAYGVPSVTYPK